jgi:hypothetical protein
LGEQRLSSRQGRVASASTQEKSSDRHRGNRRRRRTLLRRP